MTQTADHSRLLSRYSLEADLVCKTAIHVGAGKASTDVRAASDLPVVRNGAGQPYIPGSSFRGALRAGLEALLRGIGGPDHELRPWVCDPFSEKSCGERIKAAKKDLEPAKLNEEALFELARDRSCQICRLFGNTFLASRIRIADLFLTSGQNGSIYRRDGVGIDRDLRTAARNMLYDFEAVTAGTRFRLRLDLDNPEDYEIGLVLTGLELFGQGFLNVGGKRARGLGEAAIKISTLKRWSAADFFDPAKRDGTKVEEDHFESFREAARNKYVGGE